MGISIEPYFQDVGPAGGVTPADGRGVVWIHGALPSRAPIDEMSRVARAGRALLRQNPAVRLVVSRIGRPDDGTEPLGANELQFVVLLKPPSEGPTGDEQGRLRLTNEFKQQLDQALVGIEWDVSTGAGGRDDFSRPLAQGESVVKIFGPDLAELERLAKETTRALENTPGIANVRVSRCSSGVRQEFVVDRQECEKRGVNEAEVSLAVELARGDRRVAQMTAGEKKFDVAICWPAELDEFGIRTIPIHAARQRLATGAARPLIDGPFNPLASPAGGESVPLGQLAQLSARLGPLAIFRELGFRMMEIRFSAQGPNPTATKSAARDQAPRCDFPYRLQWGD